MTKNISQEELRKILTPEQYTCTQEEGTERPFSNPYWNYKEDGIYVDVVSGEPLFSSLDKYDSGTGWPSFSRPLEKENVTTREDRKLGVPRTEVRSKKVNSHLGHLFPDGPGPEKTRYCINSASLSFIPVDDLKKKNLGTYLFLFAKKKEWEIATLAGGCFWGMEHLLENLPGVIETRVGYTGGEGIFASYETVKQGNTGHAEAVQVLFDPKKIKYSDILLHYFKIHDPTTLNSQGNDKGTQYRSAIFYDSDVQKEQAFAIKKRVQDSGKWNREIVTEIKALKAFMLGEEYHQKYLDKHQGGYTCHYERKIDF